MARQSNAVYWAQRLKNMEDALLDQSYAYVENMEQQFAAAQVEVEKEIAAWYQRFAVNNEISFADAKRLLTKDELAEFTAQLMIPRDKRYYTTAVIPGDSGLTNFKVNVDESKSSLINYYRPNVLDTTTYSLHLNDDGANEGVVVGKAIGWLIGGFYKDLDGSVQLTYKAANAALENAESSTTYPAQFTDTTADYGNVNFSINDAWAEYSLTITNNGTVNANLSNCKFNITELSDEFVVDTPNLNNKVLAPGESCTATFVVKVKSEGELSADAQPFSVELTYVQDTVDEAPSASVSK